MRRHLILVVAIAVVIGASAISAASASDHPSAPRGLFVIGDNSAVVGQHVEFWGAQWWKDNDLSGGPAPASFKGFADTVDDPNCPTHWSADPGNSSPPPPSVGPDITVIVTSRATKSGPIVSGDVVELVTVHVDPGYEPNSGHPGTGTVTSIVDCGSTSTLPG